MNQDLVRIIDSIHRDKDIDPEVLFTALEEAMLTAVRKHFGDRETLRVHIDRRTGEVHVLDGDVEIDTGSLGRIDAHNARQVMTQKIREAECQVLFKDFQEKLHEIVTGTVQRQEGSTLIVNLSKTEALLPRREQIPDETFRAGDRIRAYVTEVRVEKNRLRVILSRTHPDLVKRLFELEVPEILEEVIEIKALAREPGHRSKIAVHSADPKVDPIGACVGVRGTRIKNIVAELAGEKIDIVRWSDDPATFIAFALKPAEVKSITLSPETGKARVVVDEEQLSLAIGKRGQNVRLAAKLTGWDIDVVTADEVIQEETETMAALTEIPGMTEELARLLYNSGLGLRMLAGCEPETLASVPGMNLELATAVIVRCTELVREHQKTNQATLQETASEQAAPPEQIAEKHAEVPSEPEPISQGQEQAPEESSGVNGDEQQLPPGENT